MAKKLSIFWFGVTVLIILAAIFGLLSFQFSLPYIDHDDEPDYYLGGLDARGLHDLNGYFDGVLSPYRHFSAGLQIIFENFGVQGMSETIPLMRLLSILAHLLTILSIGLTTKKLSNDIGGLIAAGLWAFSPQVFINSIFALPDPYVSLFTSLALYFAISAILEDEHHHWLIYSCIFGLLATITKYQVAALFPAFLACLWLIQRHRALGIRYLFILSLMTLATAFWALFIYGARITDLPREGAEIASDGLQNLLNLQNLRINFMQSLHGISPLFAFPALLLGLLAYGIAWWKKQPRVQFSAIVIILVSSLAVLALASLHSSVVTTNKIRYVLPASALLSVLISLFLLQLSYLVPQKWQATAQYALLGLVIAFVFSSQYFTISAEIAERRLPDQRVAIRQWAEENLEPGWIIVNRVHGSTFNPFYGGLSGAKWFDWYSNEDLLEHSLAEWRDTYHIRYAAQSTYHVEQLEASSEGQSYLNQMLRLRSFIEPNGGRGPDTVLFRLWRMDEELTVSFGEQIQLVGYDTIAPSYQREAFIPIQLYWQAEQSPEAYYSMFVHLVPMERYEVLSQVDGAPGGEFQHTITWNQAEQVVIGFPYQLPIPANIGAGEYRLVMGLYDPQTSSRLFVNQSDADSFTLATIRID